MAVSQEKVTMPTVSLSLESSLGGVWGNPVVIVVSFRKMRFVQSVGVIGVMHSKKKRTNTENESAGGGAVTYLMTARCRDRGGLGGKTQCLPWNPKKLQNGLLFYNVNGGGL